MIIKDNEINNVIKKGEIMSASAKVSWKNCGTCVYWTGDRELNSFSHDATIKDPNQKARCTCKKHFQGMQENSYIGSCECYETHPSLK